MPDDIQQYLEDTINTCLENTLAAVSGIPQEALENMATAAAVMSLSLPDHKIICLGSPLCQPLCTLFALVLNSNHMYRNRKINAVTLNGDAALISHLYPNLGAGETLRVQFESVAASGDTLLIVTDGAADSRNFAGVAAAARERQVPLVVIGHIRDAAVRDMLTEDDVRITLNTRDQSNFTEVALAVLNIFNVFLRDIRA